MTKELSIQEIKEALLTVGNLLPSEMIELCMAKGDGIIEVIKKLAKKYEKNSNKDEKW